MNRQNREIWLRPPGENRHAHVEPNPPLQVNVDKALRYLEGLLEANARNRPDVRPEEYFIDVKALHSLFDTTITHVLGAPPPTEATKEVLAAYDQHRKNLTEALERRIGASSVAADGRYQVDVLVRSIRESRRLPGNETPSLESGG